MKPSRPSRSGIRRPREREIVVSRPVSARAAVAPSATVTCGLISSSSLSSHQRQASISLLFGFWWMRRLPRGVNLKCFTAFVT